MKIYFFTLVFVWSFSIEAQQNNDTFVEVIMDGKPALMSTKTGAITYNVSSVNQSNKTIANIAKEVVDTAYSKHENTSKRHIVSKGETLYSISKAYNITLKTLITKNSLTPNSILSIGQILKTGDFDVTQKQSDLVSGTTYKVNVGDTLYSIAKMHNISVTNLKQWNNLNSNIISVGQILSIK